MRPTIIVSSAYLMILQLLNAERSSWVYTVNRNAERTHPCGDPIFITITVDSLSPMRTCWILSDRKSRMKEHSAGDTFSAFRLSMSIVGLMVLKAELKSMNNVPAYESLVSRCSYTEFDHSFMGLIN